MNQSKYSIKEPKETQIDLLLLWRVFTKNFRKILLVGILIAALLGSFRFLTNSKTYTSNVKFLINGMTLTKIDNEYTYISNGTTASSHTTQFAMNAPYIIGGDNTLEKVRDYLISEKSEGPYGQFYKQISNKELAAMLRVSYEEQIVLVSVTHTDPQIALDVSEAFRYMVPGQMDYYYGIENKYTTSETNADGDNNDQYENLQSVAKALNNVSMDNIRTTGRGAVRFALLGFFIGAIAVYIVCCLRAYFDNTIHTEDDLKNSFTLPIVGQIPNWDNADEEGDGYNTSAYASASYGRATSKKKKTKKKTVTDHSDGDSERDYSGRLLNENSSFTINEAFKSLRTNMCYTTKGEKCAVYGITAAYVQAGKSLVMSNLAVSFSMMNKKVLLLDGDLRCPVQHKIFNISNRVRGFSDVLAGLCSYDEVELRDGGYPNLRILTCGKLPPNPAELLASENMKKFIERARQDYDFIFIDLPPVSEVSDAGIISELVTGFVFVVRAGYSDRRMVDLALKSMEGFEAPLTGFILNDIDIKSDNYYKNKYYGYGGMHSKYSRSGKPAANRSSDRSGKSGSYGEKDPSAAPASADET